jgi:broad specificity phosphatase PhoE
LQPNFTREKDGMMTELWLVRHGQTDWNLEGRYQGHYDIPLNAVGLQQASRLAEKLAGESFDAIYCSDLLRARVTAETVAERLSMPVILLPGLREINQGDWQGRYLADVRAEFGEPNPNAGEEMLHERAPGGESVAEVAARLKLAADGIAAAHPAGKVLVVTHGLALATLVCQARNIPLQQVYQQIPDNTVVAVINWPPEEH